MQFILTAGGVRWILTKDVRYSYDKELPENISTDNNGRYDGCCTLDAVSEEPKMVNYWLMDFVKVRNRR